MASTRTFAAAITPASRLSGCPSLSIRHTDDPLKDDPIAAIDENCVGCGNCGEVAEAAALCPSFYRAEIIHNPSSWDRFVDRTRAALIGWFERRRNAGRVAFASDRRMSETSPVGRELAGARRIKIAVLAMGGQGGGVLADWIVALAEAEGWAAQSTSVPGVAQRTGATIYYIEMAPPRNGARPVLALMPTPGDVDIVMAAELMEAGRSVLRGLVTPDRTTLIASTHRAFAVAEKEAPGDGVRDPAVVSIAAEFAARRVVAFDMEKLAKANGSIISAAMFGALAATASLPFPRAAFEAGDPRERNRRGVEPARLRRRRVPDARQALGAGSAQAGETLRALCPIRPAIPNWIV